MSPILSIHDPRFIDIHHDVYGRLLEQYGLQFQKAFDTALQKGRVETWQTQVLMDAPSIKDVPDLLLTTLKKNLKIKDI